MHLLNLVELPSCNKDTRKIMTTIYAHQVLTADSYGPLSKKSN